MNQIEALLGCIPAGSSRPAAEHDLLALMQTVDGLDLDEPVGDDLGNRVREIGEQVAGDEKNTCHSLADLSKTIGELKAKGKLTAAEASTLRDAVTEITAELGC